MAHGIFVGKGNESIGLILNRPTVFETDGTSHIATKPVEVRAVFKNDRMIWPASYKYRFYARTDESLIGIDPGTQDRIVLHVKAGADHPTGYPGGPVDVDMFLRSCSWHYQHKYAVMVESLSEWCTINDDVSSKAVVTPTVGECEQSKPDVTYSLHIQPNYGTGQRVTRIRMYQVKSADDTLPLIDGKVIYIDVVQEGDVAVSIADYSSPSLYLYTDSRYDTPYGYANAKEYAVDALNPADLTSTIYFKIQGSIHMQSGAQKAIWFGQNGESLVPSDFTFTDQYIQSIYNISCDDGKWRASFRWKQNMPSTATMKEVVRNFQVTPSTLAFNGGICEMSFYLYKEGTVGERSTQFTITLPTSDNWVGSARMTSTDCMIWQKGGNVTSVMTNAKPTMSVNKDAQSYVKEAVDISNPSIGLYGMRYNVAAQTPSVYTHIEDVELLIIDQQTYQKTIPNIGGDLVIRFKIFTNDSTFLERSFVLSMQWNGLSQSATVVQQGSSNGNDIEVTPISYPQVANDITIYDVVDDNSVYTQYLDILPPKPSYQGGKWCLYAVAEPNLPKKIGKTIVVAPIYDIATSGAHTSTSNKFPIQVTVRSGEVDSEMRYQAIGILSNSVNLEGVIEVPQSASANARDTIYHDTEQVTVTNTTDNLSSTVTRAGSNHIYDAWIEMRENNTTAGDDAYVTPTTVTSWSLGTVKNDLTTTLFVQVKGYSASKGKERTVSFTVSLADTSVASVKGEVQQDGKDVVYDYSTEQWSSDLVLSDFVVAEGSQAAIMSPTTPIYTGNGWYAVPMKLDDNTTPTSMSYSLYIGNRDMRTEGYKYNISNYKQDSVLTPISAHWTQTGDYVTRTAKMSIAGLEDIDLRWTQVPYNGPASVNGEPNKDYEVSVAADAATWLSLDLSNRYLVSSKNLTVTPRATKVTVRYKRGSEYIGNTVNCDITQSCMASLDELGYQISVSETVLYIDEVDGHLTSPFTLVKSIDAEGTVYRISVSGNDSSLVVATASKDDGYKVSVIAKDKLRTNPKQWTLTATQLQNTQDATPTGKKATFIVKQAAYKFSALINGASSIKMGPGSTAEIRVVSTKQWLGSATLEEVPFTISQSDYDWLSITDNGSVNGIHTYTARVYSINREDKNRSVRISFKQDNTNEIAYLDVTEPNWQESELDETEINFYNPSNIYIRTFNSEVNEVPTPISSINVKWDYSSTAPSWVSCAIQNNTTGDGKQLMARLTIPSILTGTSMQSDVVRIDNGTYGIGSFRVNRHAFMFNVGFEKDAEAMNVFYVSATSTKVWSLYFVDSRMDNSDCEYTCTSDDGMCTINVSGNAIEVFANNDNISNRRIIYNATMKQKWSEQEKKIVIYQLTLAEEAEYEFFY